MNACNMIARNIGKMEGIFWATTKKDDLVDIYMDKGRTQ